MTKDKTVTMSRELADLLYGDTVKCWGLGGNAAGQLRALLAKSDDAEKVNNREMGLLQFVEKHGANHSEEPLGVVAAPVVERQEPVACPWLDGCTEPRTYTEAKAQLADAMKVIVGLRVQRADMAEKIKILCEHPSMSFHQVALLDGVLSAISDPQIASPPAPVAVGKVVTIEDETGVKRFFGDWCERCDAVTTHETRCVECSVGRLPTNERDAERFRFLMSHEVLSGALGTTDGWIDFSDKDEALAQIDALIDKVKELNQ